MRELLAHDVAGAALSIDAPRFHNLVGDELANSFADFGQQAHQGSALVRVAGAHLPSEAAQYETAVKAMG